jgi:ABC-type Fe3+/spermidine/putrescine transport system ATPase subunit
MAHLEIAGLRKSYGSGPVIDGIDLSVASGEFVTLLGPSGCGKTTTLRAIAGFIAPDAGTIRVDGADILRTPPAQRNFGVVFQNYALFPHLTVQENVAYGLLARRTPRHEIRQRVDEALAMVQLTGLQARLPRELSGGQQQRVALARAIVIRPRLLLLDEPLANLDAKLRQDVRWLIRDVQCLQKTTAIYVTHDHAEALALSDRVAVMRNGRIAQVGSPREIYQHPIEPYVAAFTGEMNALSARVVAETAPGYYRVAVAGTDLAASGPANLPTGAVLSLLVRPECLSLAVVGGQGLPVRLTSTVFVGAGLRCEVATADGQTLIMQLPASQPVMVGTEFTLAIDPAQAWLMSGTRAGVSGPDRVTPAVAA